MNEIIANKQELREEVNRISVIRTNEFVGKNDNSNGPRRTTYILALLERLLSGTQLSDRL